MGCGDKKLSKYLTQTFTAHCNAMICQQVTLSGDAEWPKVADAVIEAHYLLLKHGDVYGPLHNFVYNAWHPLISQCNRPIQTGVSSVKGMDFGVRSMDSGARSMDPQSRGIEPNILGFACLDEQRSFVQKVSFCTAHDLGVAWR